MKIRSQSQTVANSQKSANVGKAPSVAANALFEKRAYIRKAKRNWIPNHHTRSTESLSATKALDLLEASMHAIVIGLPLNFSVTIRLKRSIIKDHDHRPQHVISAYLKLAVQWLRKRDCAGTYIWVIEHDVGPTGRIHVHVLMHCPEREQVAFTKNATAKWPHKAGLDATEDGTVLCKSVGPRSYDLDLSPEKDHKRYQNQLAGFLKYHLKGIDRAEVLTKITGSDRPVAEVLGIQSHNNHPIYGRRASRSENISKSARERYSQSLLVPTLILP